jgi:hypothetical protein
MKTLLKIVVVLAILAAGAVWYLASNIDEIVRQLIVSVGSETVQTEVSLQSVQIDLGAESSATLKGLKIANPSGFEMPYAFELSEVGAAVDATTVSNDVIVIPNVLINGAQLTFEQIGSDINLQKLLDNMESGSSTSAETPDESATADEDILLAIGELRLAATGVTVVSDQLGRPFDFVLDDVVVRNIGRPDAGVSPDQAAEQIVDPVIDAVMAQAKRQLKAVVQAEIDARMEDEKAKLEQKADDKKQELEQSLRDKLKF